jgi:hypothetical protein
MRAIGTALLAVAVSVAAFGCNLILDNSEHELSSDASTGAGAAGPGGSGGQGGDSGQGGSTGGGGGQGGTAGQGGTGGQGGAPSGGGAGQGGAGGGGGAGRGGAAGGGGAGQAGTAGQGGGVDRDAGGGSGGSINRDSSIGGDADATTPDPDAADSPNDVSCSTPGASECRGRSVFICLSGMWIETQKCPNACVVNVCSGVCVPGTTQCTGNTPQTCDATGTWQNGTICPFVCSLGACTGMCVPGSTMPCGTPGTCNDGAVQTCDVNGVLGACNPAPSNCEIVPAGWTPVAKPPSSCPSGFGFEQTIYTSATGTPYTCSCGCSGTQACEGTVTLNESTSCASPVTGTRSFAITSQCVSGNYGNILNGYGYSLSDISFGASPACGTNPTPTVQPPVQATTATLCQPNLTCPSGACLSPSQAANLCVTKLGIEACPAGYPNGTTYAPWYEDTRTCGSCTCGSSLSCTLSSVLLDNGTACPAGPNYFLYATMSCSTAVLNWGLNNVQAKSTSSGSPACAETAPSNPMGGVELNQGTVSTVCCK